MEPGLRDREYWLLLWSNEALIHTLQWSPVLETGNTADRPAIITPVMAAAMEPGLRDREYPQRPREEK